jgi:hypothetical protein
MFKRSNTVDSILAQFSNTVKRLEEVSVNNLLAHDAKKAAAWQLLADANNLGAEADRAQAIASKIKSLIAA